MPVTNERGNVELSPREYERLSSLDAGDKNLKRWVKNICFIVAGAILFLVVVIFVWKLVSPKLNLYKANTEKQAVIKEQQARSEAAEYEARSLVIQATAKGEAQVIEAQAIADSQAIIAETLTPEYIQYLYIEALRDNPNQVIYVPTEAGLPILESGRAVPQGGVTVTTEP